jgi:SAM-dependent methyltransferase
VLCFAALHHIPGAAVRLEVLKHIHKLLKPGGQFIHSEWQFQNSPRLMKRRLAWSHAGLDENALEPGDTLLDWRFSLAEQSETVGQRYVHLFTEDELADMAAESGFTICKTWYADGKSGNLALYQTWQRSD